MAVDGNIKLGVDLVANNKSLNELKSDVDNALSTKNSLSSLDDYINKFNELKSSVDNLYDKVSGKIVSEEDSETMFKLRDALTEVRSQIINIGDTRLLNDEEVDKVEQFEYATRYISEYAKDLASGMLMSSVNGTTLEEALELGYQNIQRGNEETRKFNQQLEKSKQTGKSISQLLELPRLDTAPYAELKTYLGDVKKTLSTGLDGNGLKLTNEQMLELYNNSKLVEDTMKRIQTGYQPNQYNQPIGPMTQAQEVTVANIPELPSTTTAPYAELDMYLKSIKNILSTGIGNAGIELTDEEMRQLAQNASVVKQTMSEIKFPEEPQSQVANLSVLVNKFGSNAGKVFAKFVNVAKKTFDKVGKQSQGVFKKFLMIGLGVRGIMALLRRLRTMVITSIKDLAKGDPTGEFAKSLNKLTMAFNTLKANIGIAFQPLLQVVMPILTQLINYVNEATTSLAKFFATLTGQDYIYKFTANNTDLAKSTKEVGKSAKKANKQLAQYDKLIVIAQDTDSGSDSGTTDTSAGTYNKVGLGDSFNELAQMVKDAWANADFTNLGAMLGQKIQDGLNSIDWETIKSTAQKIGQSIATFLNGLISPETFSAITRTLAEGLNTVVLFFKSFGESFDWENLGTSIASGLSTFFTTFDFYGFAQTISVYLNGILDTIIAFLMGMDWEAVGQSVIALIAGIDWAGLFDRLLTIIGGILVGAFGILDGIFGDGLNAIADKISDGMMYWTTLFTNFRLFILEVVTKIVKYFKDNFGNLGTSASAPFISLKDKVVSALTSLKSSVSTLFTDIKTKITSIWDSVKTYVTDKVTSIKNSITSAFTGAKNTLSTIFETIKSKVTSVFDSMKTNIKTKINGILTNIQNGINRVIGGINSLISKINSSSKALRDYLGWGSVKSIKTVSIPKLAKGAVIPPNREFMAVLGDQKSGVNIETPLKTMIEAFNTALDSRGSGTNQPIILQVNGRQMAQVVWDENAKRYKQTGSYGLNY